MLLSKYGIWYFGRVKCDLLLTDLKESPISTRDCSENIFYKLTFIFGVIIGILIIILVLIVIIKIQTRKTQGKGNSTSIQFKRFTLLYGYLANNCVVK